MRFGRTVHRKDSQSVLYDRSIAHRSESEVGELPFQEVVLGAANSGVEQWAATLSSLVCSSVLRGEHLPSRVRVGSRDQVSCDRLQHLKAGCIFAFASKEAVVRWKERYSRSSAPSRGQWSETFFGHSCVEVISSSSRFSVLPEIPRRYRISRWSPCISFRFHELPRPPLDILPIFRFYVSLHASLLVLHNPQECIFHPA